MEEVNSFKAVGCSQDSEWDLNADIENCLVEIQSTFDKHRASVEMQDELLRVLFGGLGPSKGKRSACGSSNKSLASLLIQKSKDWDGQLNGSQIPSKWSQLMELYKGLGMVPLQEWKLCLGSDDHPHAPHVMQPCLEDERDDREALKCCCPDMHLPRLLRRDCERCCERCPQCSKQRRDVMSFHFISLIGQLQLLCKSETLCYDFLRMWRSKERWINQPPSAYPDHINEYWDGEKIRIYQDFWNPDKEWEAPIICEDPKCLRAHRAFPKELMCKSLQKGWSSEQGEYIFRCSKCGKEQHARKTFIKGDPRNFALLLHWDGFQAASTTQKDSAVVEIVILNSGKQSILGSIPILFLPLSHKELQKKHGDVLSSFLHPLMNELESSFLSGFNVNYAIPNENISSSLCRETTRLRCMLMVCTGDHPAQCKLGQVKDGGMAFCRRDKAKVELIHDNNGVHRYVYNQNRLQGRYPPPKRHVDELWQAIRMARRCSTKEKTEETLRDAGLAEEYYGANSSPLEHVAGNGEILDDILRHGSHDVTWCFSHERNVSGYLSISTNNKSNELSYSKFYSRVLCTQLYKQLHLEKDGLTSLSRDMLVVHSSLALPEGFLHASKDKCYDMHANCVFQTSSEKKANDIWDACLRLPLCPCQETIQRKGVLVGPKKPKLSNLDLVEKRGIIDFWMRKDAQVFSLDDIRPVAQFYAKVFLKNIKYMIEECVVFQSSPMDGREGVVSRGCLKKLFTHEHQGEVNVYVVIESYLNSFETFDEISGMHVIHNHEKSNCSLIVQPVACIQHKFFWLPTSINGKEILYETSGSKVRKRLLLPGKVGCFPPWLEIGDLVLAKYSDTLINKALVNEVDANHKKALLAWENEYQGQAWVDWKHVYKVLH
ncbi:hypothetical protein L7F22_031820 [Adiantum nelumboides]|nr:hypothetical protein [Adiantum nelumboides]